MPRAFRVLAVALFVVAGSRAADAQPRSDGPVGVSVPDTAATVWYGAPGTRQTVADFERTAPAPAPVSARAWAQLSPTPTSPNADVATLADSGAFPPGTMGDVGPEQYLVGINGRVRTIAKATAAPDGVLDVTLDAFFDSVRNGAPTLNPRVRYDRHSGRWFVLAINLALPNRYLLAVSDGGVLTGSSTWTFLHWANTRTLTGTPSSACVGDGHTLGIDEDALYVGVNHFCGATLGTADTYDSSAAYVIRKSSLLGSTPTLAISAFDELALGSGPGAYTPQGVDNFDVGTDAGYFIGIDNSALGRLQIRRITDPGGTPSISANLTLDVALTSTPANVPHPGSAAPLDALDDSLQQAVIRGGRLWTNHHVEVDATGAAVALGGRNGIRWYEIENLATTPSVRQSGTVFDPAASNPASYIFGSLMVSGQGHVALGATVAGAATHVNAAVTGRLAGDTLGTMDPPTTYTTNSAFTYNAQGPGPQRWGDHSYTSLDPADDMTMWTLQQYVNATDSYALRLVRLAAPPPATVTSLTPSTASPNATGVSVVVNATSIGGSGFFDPGTGFPRRLAVSFSGSGITVTSVTVLSPTSLTLTLDTVGAARGPRLVTVTNPDGQTSTLVAALTIDNVAPVAVVDNFTTGFNTPLSVASPGVLANDGDGNGDSLSAAVVTGPAHGTLTLNANGSFLYTPAAAFTGTDTFSYQASDGVALSAATTVSIAVGVNSPPTITAPTNVALVDSGSGATSAPLAFTVADVDGAAVVVTASSSNTALVANSAVVLAGSGGSRTVVVSSVAGAVGGTSTITLTASDGLLTSSATFTVQVTPQRGRPQSLAGVVARTAVTLTWAPPPFSVEPVTGYVLEAGLTPGTTFLSLPLAQVLTFSTGAPSGRYYVRVRTLTASGVSAPSEEIVVATGQAAPPLAPLALLATVQGLAVSFAWTENPLGTEINGYTLVAGSAPGLSDLAVAPLGRTLTFSAGAPAGTYYVRIIASNASGPGPASNEAVVILGTGVCTVPATPVNLTAVVRQGVTAVQWNAPTQGAIPTGYRIDVGNAPGNFNVGSFALPVTTAVSGALPGGNYVVRLVATNACGSSAPSGEVAFVVP